MCGGNHWRRNCPTPAELPMWDLCRICGSPEHFMRDCRLVVVDGELADGHNVGHVADQLPADQVAWTMGRYDAEAWLAEEAALALRRSRRQDLLQLADRIAAEQAARIAAQQDIDRPAADRRLASWNSARIAFRPPVDLVRPGKPGASGRQQSHVGSARHYAPHAVCCPHAALTR